METKTIKGTDLKYRVEINCSGLDVSIDRVECTVVGGGTSLPIPPLGEQADLEHDARTLYNEDEENVLYICFNTSVFPNTSLHLIVKAYVPDEDFPDGFRTEIAKTKLCDLYPSTQQGL